MLQPAFQDYLRRNMVDGFLACLPGPGLDSRQPFIGAQHGEPETPLQFSGEFIGSFSELLAAAVNIQRIAHEQRLGLPLPDKCADPVPVRTVVADRDDFNRCCRISQRLTHRHADSLCSEVEAQQGGWLRH